MIIETNQPDVNTNASGASAATQGQTNSDTSKPGQEAKQTVEPTMLETAQRVFDEHAKKEATPKETKQATDDKSQESVDQKSEIQKLNPTDEETDQTGEKTTKVDNGKETNQADESELEKLATAKGPVPYERFEQIYSERKELKQVVEETKPLVEGQKQIVEYCVKNQITQEQFSQGLELLALMNSNPQEAVKRMAAMVGDLQDQTGDRLPEDLAKEVAEGDLTENRAREIAKLRAQTKQGERQQKLTQQQQVQQQEQRLIQEVTMASKQWTDAKAGLDPDFRPKTSPNAVDGKYEWVREKYLAMTQQTNEKGQYVYPVRSGQDVVKYLELAYNAVEKSLASFRPKNTDKTKNLTADKSNGGTQTAPTTILEIARQVGAKHGINI